MKAENKIKSPKQDSLRGIGKLGWTEAGRLHGTIKKLIGSFNTETKVKSKKAIIECPQCGEKLKTNNLSRVPKHFPKRFVWYTSLDKTQVCKGSWCKQLSGHTGTENVWQFTTVNNNTVFNVDDIVVIDFTRDILSKYAPERKEFTTELLGVENIKYLANDGSVHCQKQVAYFEGVPEPIPTFLLGKHIIKL